jgi:hypothetical protein
MDSDKCLSLCYLSTGISPISEFCEPEVVY